MMHTNKMRHGVARHGFVCLGLAWLMALTGGAGVLALDPPQHEFAEGEAIPVVLYSGQAATEAWQWHKPALPPKHWFGVVGSEKELKSLASEFATLDGRLPVQVDWDREVLLVASLGEAPTGGYAVRIKQVTFAGERVHVQTHLRSPGPGDMVIQVITYPVDFVRLSRDRLEGKELLWEFEDQRGRLLATYRWPCSSS